MKFKTVRTLLLSLIMALGVYVFYSWPLSTPRFFTDNIPSSARLMGSHSDTSPEFMEMGDHLQLMYHFWLLGDYLTGRTPFLHNVYELNNGDDAERKMINTHHFPFPLLFGAVNAVGGKAVAWNVTSFVSIWLTFLFTWLLARRYLKDDVLCALGALVVILLPYRYSSLFEGSPEGFAMMWTPLIWLGLEMVLRERRWIGGVWAGMAVAMTAFCDSHVFLFSLYYLPLMGLFACLNSKTETLPTDEEAPPPKSAKPVVVGLALAAIGPAIAIGYGLYKKSIYKNMDHAGKRAFTEIEQFSLPYQTFYSTNPKLYLGISIACIIGLGLILLFRRRRETPLPRLVLAGLLVAGVLASIFLCLGVTSLPLIGDRIYRLAYDYLPMYDRIRQPAKIWCYMPLALSMLVVISFGELRHRIRNTALVRLIAVLLIAVATYEYGSRITVKLCTLATEQLAYQAVLDDADERNVETPRTIVLPIFKATSAAGSTYLHYASLYRLRMLNGYYPVLKPGYEEEIFQPLKPFNYGTIENDMLDSLLDRDIEYILFHQDKMSLHDAGKYPSNLLLKTLLNHPRLALLEQDRQVVSFRILNQPKAVDTHHFTEWEFFTPHLSFNAEISFSRQGDALSGDQNAIAGGYVSLYKPGKFATNAEPVYLSNSQPGHHLKVRLKGQGIARVSVEPFDEIVAHDTIITTELTVDTARWQWFDVSLSKTNFCGWGKVRVTCEEGAIDFDYVKWSGLTWDKMKVGEEVRLPASAFEHQGYIDIETEEVVYFPYHAPYGDSFQSASILLPAGIFEIEMVFESTLDYPDQPGRDHVFSIFATQVNAQNNEDVLVNTAIHHGQPGKTELIIRKNHPIKFKTHFTRLGEVRYKELVVRFIKPLPEAMQP